MPHYSTILCCCQRSRYACNCQISAESATPTSISTITATIIPDASARASDSMIKRPIPRSAPMNSPTMTPIRAKEIAGESDANTHAIVEGITTVRVICHSLAPSSRATLTKPSSIERAPSNVLKNTRNTTTIHDVTIFDVSPIPNASTMIGDTSKIVTSWIVVVFLVFFNTFEGARSIDEGFVNVARLLGASEWQITRTVVIPSTMAWVFASLSPAISFALIGVIVAERGIGRLIIESEARAEASGMMVAVIVLMLVGVALSALIWQLQAYLLRWQQHNMVE